jgi:outer membrane protein OmpA-like peptidoglycan-associated protein
MAGTFYFVTSLTFILLMSINRNKILILLTLCLLLGNKANAQLYALTTDYLYIFFDTDSYEISNAQKQIIKEKLLELGATNIKEIYIEGHTDTFATDEYNAVLAANRANAASQCLYDFGVPERFVKTESFGESQIISDDQSKNRRAKMFFVYESDNRSKLYPPKYIMVKTIDAKTKKPIKTSLGFDYDGIDMKFSETGYDGKSPVFALITERLQLIASADFYLSNYLILTQRDIDQPTDTLLFTLELTPVKVTGVFTFNSIFFETDTDIIRPESAADLARLLQILQTNKSTFIEIQGHMNYPYDRPMNSIQDRYNKELSYKRAKAVNDYLVTAGVSQSRLTYKGMSNSRMKFPYPSSRLQEDQNKRVEIYTLKKV